MKPSPSFFTPLFLLLGLVALLGAACGDDAVEIVSGATTTSGDDVASDISTPQDQNDSGTDTSIDPDAPAFDGIPTPTPDRSEVPPLPSGGEDAPPETLMNDNDTDRWQIVPQRNDLSGTAPHPILDLVIMDDTHIGVRFEAIAEGCSGAEAFADESETEVRIELFVGLPPEAAVTSCVMMQVQKQIVVELASPLGNRGLIPKGAPSGDAVQITPELSLDDYIGLSEADAVAKAEVSGRPARVVKVNGESLITTDDYVPARLNLEVVDGIVTGLKTDAGEEAGTYTGY